MQVLSGKVVSAAHRKSIYEGALAFQRRYNEVPHLTIVLVGCDPASEIYVRNKQKACEKVGIKSSLHHLDPQKTTPEDLEQLLVRLSAATDVHGILVQLPLPKPFDASRALRFLSSQKDVDGLTILSMGRLWAGESLITPCTPQGIMEILKHYKISVEGRHAVVVGRSLIVGQPMAQLLTQAHATVTLCHSKTQNLSEHTHVADLVVVAAGRPQFLGREDFKKGAVVVDVGIHRQNGKICGDVCHNELGGHVAALTPVPGGVGPMTITQLLRNTLTLAIHSRTS